MAAAIAGGTPFNQALYDAIEANIDAPLWAADPTIDAFAKVLPVPIGGTDGNHEANTAADGNLIDFRDTVLLGARDAFRAPFKEALLPSPAATSRIAEEGTEKKALEAEAKATTPKTTVEATPVATTVSTVSSVAKHRKATTNPVGSALKSSALTSRRP